MMRWIRQHSLALLGIANIMLGILLALIAQPPPLAFAAGWSAPRRLVSLDLRDSKHIVLAPDQTFHLVWVNENNDVPQVYLGRLNLRGEWVQAPQRISSAGARSIAPQLTVAPDNRDLVLYVEKSAPGGLMVATNNQPPRLLVEAAGDMRQPTLTSDGRTYYAAWSEGREGQPRLYFAAFDAQLARLAGPTRLSPENALAVQPTLLAARERLHLLYFADDNRFVDLIYRALSLDLKEQSTATLSHRAQTGNTGGYPVSALLAPDGSVYLFESQGSVRLSMFDAQGRAAEVKPITLERVRSNSAVDAQLRADKLWVIWSSLPTRSRAAQIYVRAFGPNGQPLGDEQRLTFTSGGAFQPHWFMDASGTQHAFWVENTSDIESALFYANTAQPAGISPWQRLGFAGPNGLGTLLVTIATSFMFVIPILVVNIWRVVLVAVLLVVAHRLVGGRLLVMLGILIASELVLSAPSNELIGQQPIALSAAAHWVFILPALGLTLLLVRAWRKELSEVLRWPALAFLWSYIYYWMNALVILREGYAL